MAKKIDAPAGVLLHDASGRGTAKPLQGAYFASVALAAAALAAFPGVASAQGMNAGRPAQLGGPDRPFTLGVQATTTYDSNPTRGSDAAGAIRDLRNDEIIISPSVTVGYSRTMGQQGLSLTGVFGYDKYTRNTELSAEHIEFSAIGNRAIGAHCSVNGSGIFNRGQSNLENVTVNVSKNVIQTYDFSVGETCGTATGLTQSLSVTHGSTHNSDSTLVDYNSTGVSGSVGYSNHVVGNVALVASYSKTSYVDIPALSLTTPDSFDVTSIGFQITRPIGARLSGNAAVFYSQSHQEERPGAPSTGKSSYSGLTASAGLTYIVGPRLILRTDIGRNVSGSILQDVSYAVVTNADLAADYTVSSRISASLGGNWSRDSYRGRVATVDLGAPDWQSTSSVYGRVSMLIGRRAAVSLGVSHEWGDSDISLYEYSTNRVSLTLSSSI